MSEEPEVWVDHDYPRAPRDYEQCDTCHGDRTMQHHCDLLAAARQAARQVGLFLEDGKRDRLNVALVLLEGKA